MTTVVIDNSLAPWSTQKELIRAVGVLTRSAGEGSESLLGELASFLQSSPTLAQIERARKVLQAVTVSDIPFITSNDSHRENLNFILHNVLDNILDFSSIREVITIGQLSHHFRLQVRSYLVRSINIMLKEWFSDVVAFRAMMRTTGCVISGSTVLSFLNREQLNPGDLDVYVSNGSSCTQVLQYLVNKEGYTLQDTARQNSDDGEHQHSTDPATFSAKSPPAL
ncbi:hypothetical protein FRC02_010533 [Tulasnella sp. 418]|nr:hypothetical protein FRC02_010533 [Tulasnella sp. 418]